MFMLSASFSSVQSVQSLSRVWLFATPWITARQASLSITNSQSSLRLTSIESVMPSSHLILCCPLLLLPPIPPSIRVFSNESTLRIRWPKCWSFSFSISPSNEQPGLISFRTEWTGWIFLQSKGLSRVFSNTTVQKHQFFGTHEGLFCTALVCILATSSQYVLLLWGPYHFCPLSSPSLHEMFPWYLYFSWRDI